MEDQLITNQVKHKLLEALEKWSVTYKLIGTPPETPRYSQIAIINGAIHLKSTITKLAYTPDLTKEETKHLIKAIHEDPSKVWNEWKQIRTDYLTEKHPTISPY